MKTLRSHQVHFFFMMVVILMFTLLLTGCTRTEKKPPKDFYRAVPVVEVQSKDL